MTETQKTSIEAIVDGVFEEREYAVAYSSDPDESSKTSITFSLDVWQGDYPPKKGQVVLLTGVEKFKKGWRARSARPIPYEQPETKNSRKVRE